MDYTMHPQACQLDGEWVASACAFDACDDICQDSRCQNRIRGVQITGVAIVCQNGVVLVYLVS